MDGAGGAPKVLAVASDSPLLVLSYKLGRTLTHYMRERKLTPRQWVCVLRAVALSLAQIHAKGIIHGSVKAGDFIIRPTQSGDFLADIIDFGKAKTEMEAALEPTFSALETSVTGLEPSASEMEVNVSGREPSVGKLGTNFEGSVMNVGWTEVAGSLVEWADSPGNEDVKRLGKLMYGVLVLSPKIPRALIHLMKVMTHGDPQSRPSMLRVADLLDRLLAHIRTHQ